MRCRDLQGFAQACKSLISKGFSLLRFALGCTVLRSRWCQSGVRSPWIACPRFLSSRSDQYRCALARPSVHAAVAGILPRRDRHPFCASGRCPRWCNWTFFMPPFHLALPRADGLGARLGEPLIDDEDELAAHATALAVAVRRSSVGERVGPVDNRPHLSDGDPRPHGLEVGAPRLYENPFQTHATDGACQPCDHGVFEQGVDRDDPAPGRKARRQRKKGRVLTALNTTS
jgi:hypothetical protein